MNGTVHQTVQHQRQGYVAPWAVPFNPFTVAKRCRHCGHFAVVFDANCTFGSIRVNPNATCKQWRAS